MRTRVTRTWTLEVWLKTHKSKFVHIIQRNPPCTPLPGHLASLMCKYLINLSSSLHLAAIAKREGVPFFLKHCYLLHLSLFRALQLLTALLTGNWVIAIDLIISAHNECSTASKALSKSMTDFNLFSDCKSREVSPFCPRLSRNCQIWRMGAGSSKVDGLHLICSAISSVMDTKRAFELLDVSSRTPITKRCHVWLRLESREWVRIA